MRRFAALSAALAAAALAGCGGQPSEEGALSPVSSAAPANRPDADKLSADYGALQRAAYVSDAGPDSGLPAGDLFDGSASRASLLGAGGVRGSGRWTSARPTTVKYTAPSRRDTLRTGDVPAPGTLPAVQLPRADPSAGARGGGPVLAAFDAFQRATYSDVTGVFSRSAWGAAARRGRDVAHHPSRVTVHHTDGHPRTALSDAIEEVRGIQRFHMNERGWADIGYHFVIDGAGRVFEGRRADVLGAHAESANMNNIGIALMGDYNRDRLNDDQKTTLRRLITFLALRYRTDPSQRGFIQPHMHYNNTDCPGKNVVGFLDELRREVDGETSTLVNGGRPDDARPSFEPLAVIQRL